MKATAGRVANLSMQERKTLYGDREVQKSRRKHAIESVRCQSTPRVRRWIARDGDREAVGRRSEIDRSGGLGKPRGEPCGDGDHVATFAATPHHRTTRWHSLPRDRRGAWVGGRTRPASGRDVAPAPCAAASRPRSGFHAARKKRAARECHASMREASGVSVPAGTADESRFQYVSGSSSRFLCSKNDCGIPLGRVFPPGGRSRFSSGRSFGKPMSCRCSLEL